MGLAARALAITAREGAELEKLARAHSTPRQGAPRARILLLAAAGISNSEIARRLETSRPTLLDGRKRFEAERLVGEFVDELGITGNRGARNRACR